MVDMSYSVAGLYQGADGHQDVASGAEQVVTALLGLAVAAEVLGTVPSAAGFATGLDRARLGIGRAVATESARRLDRARHTAATAQLGDQLTADSTRISQQSPVRSAIVDGMR